MRFSSNLKNVSCFAQIATLKNIEVLESWKVNRTGVPALVASEWAPQGVGFKYSTFRHGCETGQAYRVRPESGTGRKVWRSCLLASAVDGELGKRTGSGLKPERAVRHRGQDLHHPLTFIKRMMSFA